MIRVQSREKPYMLYKSFSEDFAKRMAEEKQNEKVEDAAAELQQNLEEKEAQHNLFVEKVNVSGTLHTRRALLANRIGGLRSETLIKRDDLEESLESKLEKLNAKITDISKDIREFSPKTVKELHDFRDATNKRFDELEALLEKTKKTEKTGDDVAADEDPSE